MRHERSFDAYSPDELRKLAQQAGIRSGEVRRAKRAAIEREKVQNTAIRESQMENLLLLKQAITLCKQLQKKTAPPQV